MNKWLTVPKNEKGVEEYDYGINSSDNLFTFIIPPEEYSNLWVDGIFDKINENCELEIDDFESEIIPVEQIEKAIRCVSSSLYPTFYNALQLAEKYHSFLATDF